MRVCLRPARMRRIRHRSQLSNQSAAGVTSHCNIQEKERKEKFALFSDHNGSLQRRQPRDCNVQVSKPSTTLYGCCQPPGVDIAMLVTPNALSLHCSSPA